MKEKDKIEPLEFQYIEDVLDDVCTQNRFSEAEEFAMAYEETGDYRIYKILNEIRLKIAKKAFDEGLYDDAERAIMLMKDCPDLVSKFRNQIKEQRISQNQNSIPKTTGNSYASLTQKDKDDAMEQIMNDPPVYIDPEEEYRQKVEQMAWNGIVMRGIVLSIEAKLALSNKREGVLDGFNKSKIENFYDIMKNVDVQFQKSGSCLQAYNFKDAEMYLAKAEADFLELCPEVVKKQSSTIETGPKKPSNNILSDVKPQNYQPKERDALTVKGDEADVMKCLKVAEKALGIEDYVKAEKFLKKAERIRPTQAAKMLLDQIRISKEAKLIAAKKAAERKLKEEQEAAVRKIKEEKEATERKIKEKQEAAERKKIAAQAAAERESRQEKGAAERKAREDLEAVEKKARLEQEAAALAANARQEQLSKPKLAEEATETQNDNSKKRKSMNIDEQADVKPIKPTITSAQDMQSSEEGKQRRAEQLLIQAQEAYCNEDLNAAEKLGKKALLVNPSAEAESFLEKLHSSALKNNENTNPNVTKKANKKTEKFGKIQENKAKDLVRKAEECVASGDFRRAEECLQNARKSDPNVDVNKVEASLRATRASRSSTDDTVFTDQDHKSRRDKDFILNFNIGTNAMNANEFTKADRFLKIAYGIKPTRNVEDLLRQVQFELYGQGNTNTSREKDNENSFAVNMLEAKQLHRDAKKAFNDKNYDDAEALALQALKYNPLNTTKELLNQIKTAKQRVAKEQNILEESKPPKTLLSGDKTDEKFKLLNKAPQLLDKGNIEEADNLMWQSKSYGECAETEILYSKINELKSQKNTGRDLVMNYGPSPTISHQREEAQKNFEIAKTAFNENDLDKAEHYFVKSDRIFPSDQAKAMLQQVRSAVQCAKESKASEQTSSEHTQSEYVNPNPIESDDKVQVDKCIEVAMKAISEEQLEKALHFLEKAQRIQSTDKAKTLIEDIQHSKQQKGENDEKAEGLIASAIEAMGTEDYDFAEMLLTTAKIKHKSTSAKNLLKRLKETMSQDSKTAEKEDSNLISILVKNRKHSKKTVEKQKTSANNYYTLAYSYVSNGKLEDAETILIIAQNTYPTNTTNELLSEIRDKIYSRDAGHLMKKPEYEWEFSKKAKQGIVNRNAYKSNSYLQMAERAFFNGSYDLAEEFLLEANDLYPCKEFKHLLSQVQNAKSFMNAPPAKKKK